MNTHKKHRPTLWRWLVELVVYMHILCAVCLQFSNIFHFHVLLNCFSWGTCDILPYGVVMHNIQKTFMLRKFSRCGIGPGPTPPETTSPTPTFCDAVFCLHHLYCIITLLCISTTCICIGYSPNKQHMWKSLTTSWLVCTDLSSWVDSIRGGGGGGSDGEWGKWESERVKSITCVPWFVDSGHPQNIFPYIELLVRVTGWACNIYAIMCRVL